MTDPKVVEVRRRTVAILEELRVAGFLRYTLSSQDLAGPEPHLDIYAERQNIERSAWGHVSPVAAKIWDYLRTGKAGTMTQIIDAIRNATEV